LKSFGRTAVPFNASLALAANPSTTGAGLLATGATPAATVAFYRAAWQAAAGALPWTLAGTAVADGTGRATLVDASGVGNWLWLAAQLDGAGNAVAYSPAQYQAVADPTQKSTWELCCDSLKTAVDSLLLAGIPPAKVVKRWYPGNFKNIDGALPMIQICPFGAEEYPGTLNNTDDVAYPVLLILIDAADRESTKNLTRDLRFREQISRAVRFQVPAGIQSVYYTDLRPDVLINPDAWEDGRAIQALIFSYRSRERRGVY
jgi:hypothetical protein